MYCSLRQLNIKDITLRIVVGGEEQYSGISINIFAILIKYLTETNRIRDNLKPELVKNDFSRYENYVTLTSCDVRENSN